ncbi:hypothetical protein MKW98_012107, partial [Papaver atlanticum]
ETLESELNAYRVNLFKEVVEKIDLDQSWDDTVDRKVEVRKDKLESELNAYRTNLIKESIRMGYNDFGDFHYSHGNLSEAFKNYALTRDYCTTSKHILQMCLNAILVSIEMGQFSEVPTFISTAEQVSEPLDPVAIAKLLCTAGLYHLEANEYKLAACKFLEAGPGLGDTYTEVISRRDVATYGGLCALASFDRIELKNKLIDNSNYQNFLELVPEVREIINDFYSSHYTSCLKCLGNLKAVILLDIHLHDHVKRLYSHIRQKALIQYVDPFVPVDLRMIASTFGTDVPGLDKELEALITDNQIQFVYRPLMLMLDTHRLACRAKSTQISCCCCFVRSRPLSKVSF